MFGLGKGGRKSGRAGTGRGTAPRKNPGRGSTRRTGSWRPSTKGDVVNTPNAKKAATPATKKPAPKQPAAKTASGKPQPEQKARPAKPAEPHPYRNPTPVHTTKGNIMASVFGKRWRQNAEEIHIQASRYDPEKMPDYLDDLAEMTRAFEEESKALGKIAAVSESELPVDPRLVEYIVQTQATMRKVAEDAGAVVAHFKKMHENELARHEVRRRGEEKWNVQ